MEFSLMTMEAIGAGSTAHACDDHAMAAMGNVCPIDPRTASAGRISIVSGGKATLSAPLLGRKLRRQLV
ncbi:hypothetical protein [Mesorhizobium sp. M0040]|uniref:hypothetical protein n=1 Tax=Mesorhizobium sp. M0040 TaxID=2956855 RepID=UPI003338D953